MSAQCRWTATCFRPTGAPAPRLFTGAYVALHQALKVLVDHRVLRRIPLLDAVAAISVGLIDDELLLDLCYEEDFRADVDFNLVMTKKR